MLPETLGVIGLGPMGGSIAWGAVRSGVQRVIGWSSSTKDGAAAARAGAISEFVHESSSVFASAELVVFATTPAEAEQLLERHATVLSRRGVICTDVAGVKRPIVDRASRLNLGGVFAGSHPLVGGQGSGFASARPHALRGELVYVTPVPGGDRAADEVRDFWSRSLGAHPVTLSAEQHDMLVAWTEQLPLTVAAALAAAFAQGSQPGVTCPPGLLDTTRLANTDPDAWSTILLANRRNVLDVLNSYSAEIDGLRRALEAEDAEDVRRWLARAAAWRSRHGP
jgi:prephenate dehydrogenase